MATMLAGSQMATQMQRSSLAGTALRQPAQRAALRPARQVVRADSTNDTKEKKEEKKASGPFSPPALDSSWPSPIFGGSTGGLMRKAQVGGQSRSIPFLEVLSMTLSCLRLQWAKPSILSFERNQLRTWLLGQLDGDLGVSCNMTSSFHIGRQHCPVSVAAASLR